MAKRMFEKSCQCQVHRTWYRLHASSPEAGANPGPRIVSLDLPGLFKHPLRALDWKSRKIVPRFATSGAVTLLGLESLFDKSFPGPCLLLSRSTTVKNACCGSTAESEGAARNIPLLRIANLVELGVALLKNAFDSVSSRNICECELIVQK